MTVLVHSEKMNNLVINFDGFHKELFRTIKKKILHTRWILYLVLYVKNKREEAVPLEGHMPMFLSEFWDCSMP